MSLLTHSNGQRSETLHVHVVDDSSVVREILTHLLQRDNRIQVTTSRDPLVALQKMEKQRPDVIITDLEMPRMHGITFVRQVMQQSPLPIIVCSGNALPGAQNAILALKEGALEIITKPKVGVKEFLEESGQRLLEVVWQVSRSRIRKNPLSTVVQAKSSVKIFSGLLADRISASRIVVIGASTGGTEAIREILQSLPANGPGIAIVQHMPEAFTKAFADHLNRDCSMQVKEAESGDRILPGRVLVAPGGRHLTIHRSGLSYLVSTETSQTVSRHRPSVDVLFHSAAYTAGNNAVGILLTGMGKDGADGLLAMRNAGAYTIAQNEASSVVFGMPREAIALGAVCDVLPLNQIPAAILSVPVDMECNRTRRL